MAAADAVPPQADYVSSRYGADDGISLRALSPDDIMPCAQTL